MPSRCYDDNFRMCGTLMLRQVRRTVAATDRMIKVSLHRIIFLSYFYLPGSHVYRMLK
jgi:hypothetical protein